MSRENILKDEHSWMEVAESFFNLSLFTDRTELFKKYLGIYAFDDTPESLMQFFKLPIKLDDSEVSIMRFVENVLLREWDLEDDLDDKIEYSDEDVKIERDWKLHYSNRIKRLFAFETRLLYYLMEQAEKARVALPTVTVFDSLIISLICLFFLKKKKKIIFRL